MDTARGKVNKRTEIPDADVQSELFTIFSKVVEQTSEVVVIINDEGMVLHCNARFEKLSGFTKDEVVGNSFRSFIAEEQNKTALDFVVSTVKSNKNFSAEFMIRHKDNRAIFTEFIITPISDDVTGKILYYIATGKDVTERKKVQELVHRDELLLRFLFEKVSDIIIIVSPEGRIESMTPCSRGCDGRHGDGKRSPDLFDFVDDKYKDPLKDFITSHFANKPAISSFTFEFNCPTQGKQLLEAEGHILKNGKGMRLILLCKNVHEQRAEEQRLEKFKEDLQNELDARQKEIQSAQERMNLEMAWRLEAEEELRLKEERLDLAIEVSDYGLWDLNFESGNLYHNEHFSNILGFEKGYSGKITLDIYESMMPPDDRRIFKQAFSEHADNLTPKFEIEHRLVAANRKGKWLSVKGKVVARDAKDNPLRFIGRIEDITHRKLIERKLQSALEKEKELHDLKSYFISKVSHEFRTPLATILSSIEILENYYPKLKEQEKEKQFQTIHKCIDDLIEMLTDVITLNKPELANPEVGKIRIELIGFISQLIDNIKQSFPKTPAITFMPSQETFPIKFSEKLLKQIINNLLTNAIKYTPEDKAILIKLNCGDTIELSVTDEGIGILPEDQKNLFEPFFRGKNVGGISGSGLGLSILKQSIESLSGRIDFVSEPGAGTTFTVYLPVPQHDQLQ